MKFVKYPTLLDSINKEWKFRYHMLQNTTLLFLTTPIQSLTIRGSSDKLCAPTFLTGNTKSFIRMDLLCPVAEAWSRACSSFQRCSCSKEGTWCQHPEDFLFKTETVLSSLLLWICSLFLGNNYCLIFHFLHTMFCVSWSLELRERLLHQMQSFFCFNPVYRLSIALW